ncbi:MAG: cytochrome d ubiquinol oxidase subunit II [Deltaproteobacteria bacterium RIFOXYD12_FULL_57_12]|nr:MAG: cytochrome d ubiquinol oxidase subunit II [Deltaproteobacteria bacterium RIFOXYD12_FULL_57_12]
MFTALQLSQLQQLWWAIISVVGALFIFLTFVQGGQTLLVTEAQNNMERRAIANSLGRKWELTFTTLVLFGGALFAAFPLFYATSFGGAYWLWIAILFTFILQAVSYEFRGKPGNLLGTRTYDRFLFINGSVGLFLIGVAIGTFFTGADFSLNEFNAVTWQHPLRGLEAILDLFNVTLGLFLVFLARMLGAMYLVNNIDFIHPDLLGLNDRLRRSAFKSLLLALPFLLYVLASWAVMTGYAVEQAHGRIVLEEGKYLHNLLAMPANLVLLGFGFVLVLLAVIITRRTQSSRGIWLGGFGSILMALAIFFTAGFNNTAFYPSRFDLQSSLTIANASSSRYTLTVMSYVALAVPIVLAYIAYFWHRMDAKKISAEEIIRGESAREMY